MGEGGEGVEDAELVESNQGRLPEGGVCQCQAKGRAEQGGLEEEGMGLWG